MFLQVCVILFTRGEVPDQVQPPGPGTPLQTRYTPWTRYTPGTRYTPLGPGPPGPVTPQDQVHPLEPGTPPGTRYTPLGLGTPPWDQVHPPGPGTPPWHSMLGDTVYARAVRILLECNLV